MHPQEPLEQWQCANAVEGAGEAAMAARRARVGGARPADALHDLLHHAPLWAMAAALALNWLQAGVAAPCLVWFIYVFYKALPAAISERAGCGVVGCRSRSLLPDGRQQRVLRHAAATSAHFHPPHLAAVTHSLHARPRMRRCRCPPPCSP